MNKKYFNFSLRGADGKGWLEKHPMPARNESVRKSHSEAASVILSNYNEKRVTLKELK